GVKSQGMILASSSGDTVKVVFLEDSVPAGAEVR
ncbi:MAG: hypothetical protein J6U75_01095, partial [Clostridia bacterium]|nr:hypothetical protein [Clostridia bacterium]